MDPLRQYRRRRLPRVLSLDRRSGQGASDDAAGSGAVDVALPERKWISNVPGNVKITVQGTYHNASARHLHLYTSRRFSVASIAA